jgi:N-acetyl-anhydromuramyl-L-alanine amidase AmpD
MSLPKIISLPFPESQYYKVEHPKKRIVWHHTASGRGMDGDYKHWLNNDERIATCIIIEENGDCGQLFPSQYWGHHIGCHHPNNRELNESSIGVELDSWGGLNYDLKTGKYLSYTGAPVPKEDVIEYPLSFRGFRFYKKYTHEQIESARKLALHWHEKYGIILDYNEDMWDVSKRALEGAPGNWAHVSFRKDKGDVHPQPEFIQMLKELKKNI